MVRRSGDYGLREFYSGRMHERDILGEPKWSPKFIARHRALVNKYKERARVPGYAPFKPVVKLIRELTPDDPTNPEKEFPTDVRLELIEKFGLSGQDSDRLRYYSALKTAVDTHHGTDGWFEYEDPRGRIAIARIDASIREEKVRYAGEREAIVVDSLPNTDEDAYIPAMEEYANEIYELLSYKMRRNGMETPIDAK